MSGRLNNFVRRTLSVNLQRRPVCIRSDVPRISFSFDDFPASAWRHGGQVLKRYGVRATYYTSLGLVDTEIPAGRAFSADDLRQVVQAGHEVGCHTYSHADAWLTRPSEFLRAIETNRQTLKRYAPGLVFKTLSYPINCPRPANKAAAGKYFSCCRGGGRALPASYGKPRRIQYLNSGVEDALSLQTFFLEKCAGELGVVEALIEENLRQRAWLILSTHDVCEKPSPYGCRVEFFSEVVKAAVDSGARVQPVYEAWTELTRS